MATVVVNGPNVEITYTVPTSAAQEFKDDLVAMWRLDPASTNRDVADEIANRVREEVRQWRRNAARSAAGAADPGTVDFS